MEVPVFLIKNSRLSNGGKVGNFKYLRIKVPDKTTEVNYLFEF